MFRQRAGYFWVLWGGWVHFTIHWGTCKTMGLRAIFIAPTKLKNRFLLPFIGRHSLSHARWACQLPQRGSREGFFHSSGYSLKSGVTGDFHRPYANQKILVFTIHRGTLPQSALSGCQLPQRGSREGFCHSTGCPLNRGVTGDFHRPYETQKFLHSTIQRSTR